MGESHCFELSTLVVSDYSDFTDFADHADYIQLPESVNMVSTVTTPQVHKIGRIYPRTRKLPAGFSLWKGRNVVVTAGYQKGRTTNELISRYAITLLSGACLLL